MMTDHVLSSDRRFPTSATSALRFLNRVVAQGPLAWLAGLLCVLAVGDQTVAAEVQTDASTARPNVVVILVDDMGWMDLSCQGSDYFRTPNIDALAASGVRFTNAYAACAVCSPTRAALVTGKSPDRVGVTDWIRGRFQRGKLGTPDRNPTEYVGNAKRRLLCPPNPYWLEHEEVTFAERFREAGYATGFIGKWHLGDPDWYPASQGYDENVGGCDLGQPPSYFDPYYNWRYSFDGNLEPRRKGEFLTHREGDEAADFIRRHAEERFLLHYCPYAVHTPIQAIPEVAERYQREGKSEVNAKYAAMVESVDDAVGTIVEALVENDLRDDTLILFLSDNGGKLGPTNNLPLRSGKGFAYEGGIRVPAIVSWPSKITANWTCETPVISMDVMPTICAAAGIAIEDDAELDGVSLLPLLRSGGTNELAARDLHWHFPHYRDRRGPYSMIRSGQWKLIRWFEGDVELYHLGDDLGEREDRSESEPAKTAELLRRLDARLKDTGAKLPRPNPDFAAK